MGYAIFLAEVAHRVDLIFHQGNQRRYYNSRSLHQQRGQLVTQRFSAASGHQHKGVVASQQVFDNSFLISLKSVEPEVFLQLIC